MSANSQLVVSSAPSRDDILRVLKLNPNSPETMALVFTCERYGLDPILKHALLIQGTLYVTRDGLMHVAHVSGAFDGLEVEQLGETQTHYIAKATVWRKDMNRPFVFQGRFPKSKPMAKEFGPEMAEKVAECRALRRAFDISLCSREETWENDEPVDRTGDRSADRPRHQSPQGPQSPQPKALSAPVQATPQSRGSVVNDERMARAKEAFKAAAEAVSYKFVDGADRIHWLNTALGRPGDCSDGFTAEDIEAAALALPDLITAWAAEQKPVGVLPEAGIEPEPEEEPTVEAAPEELTDPFGTDDPFAEIPAATPSLPRKGRTIPANTIPGTENNTDSRQTGTPKGML